MCQYKNLDISRKLTLEAVSHLSPLISGVQTKRVRPTRKKQTEYDRNIDGHCHMKTIFHRGFHSPTDSLSLTEPVREPLYLTSLSIRSRKRRTSAFSGYPPFGNFGGFPRSCSTAICCAARSMARTERTRLEYQNADASQYASPTAFHENEPMVAAAKIAL